MTIAKNEHTEKFDRENRFLIDDPNSGIVLAYTLSKPLKLYNVYNGSGVYKFVLQKVVSTHNDNPELMVADYYKYYKEDNASGTGGGESGGQETAGGNGKEGWI